MVPSPPCTISYPAPRSSSSVAFRFPLDCRLKSCFISTGSKRGHLSTGASYLRFASLASYQITWPVSTDGGVTFSPRSHRSMSGQRFFNTANPAAATLPSRRRASCGGPWPLV